MSSYLDKRKKVWRYDFELEGKRYSQSGFQTKKEAKEAEFKRREEVLNPKILSTKEDVKTPITFFELLTKRLDHVKDYQGRENYVKYRRFSRRWCQAFGASIFCADITKEMVKKYLSKKKMEVSAYTANKELTYLRAAFNWGIEEDLISSDPTKGIKRYPSVETSKYVPPINDILAVISVADNNEVKDYLWTIFWAAARVNEINNLKWEDVDFERRQIILYTRKKKGGDRKPRSIKMSNHLYDLMLQRYQNRDISIPWVYFNPVTRKAFNYRSKIMKTLCKKAGVKHFTYHNVRHCTASVMNSVWANRKDIQEILGHEKLSTTDIYIHSIARTQQEVIHAFEEEVKKSHTKQKKD
ncbi:MAG: site-specific integrase [bacterium]